MKKSPISLLLFGYLVFTPTTAWAYLDPATGSLLVQGLIAGFFAMAFSLKMYWQRIKSFLMGKSLEHPSEQSDGEHKEHKE